MSEPSDLGISVAGQTIDSDVGSDVEVGVQSDGDEGGAVSGSESVCSTSSATSLPPQFVCERCRLLQEGRSAQELEEERLASESACAKYLMDGDYKCQCHSTEGRERRRYNSWQPSTAEREEVVVEEEEQEEEEEEEEGEEEGTEMPAGMLALTECAICLECYRFGCVLCGLPCGHSFHQVCIVGWLSRDNHCCPVCRWPPYKAKPCSLHSNIDT